MEKRNIIVELTKKGIEGVRLQIQPGERALGFHFLQKVLPALRELDQAARGAWPPESARSEEEPTR
jgi:hypothetical protein